MGKTASPGAEEASAECIVHRIVPAALNGVWHKVKPMIREAVRWSPITSRLETINDVERKTYDGTYQLWIVFKGGDVLAAALTCIAEHSQCKVLDVVYGAGEELEEWLEEIYKTLDDEAVEQDCRFIRIEGRHGWGDALSKVGFQKAYSTFMREV